MTTVPEALLPYRVPRSARPNTGPNQFVEAQLHSVTAAGLKFTIKDWDGGKHVFGPAPWTMSRVEPAPQDYAGGTHDHLETAPTAGARLLVLFLGEGVDRPWVLGWWPS